MKIDVKGKVSPDSLINGDIGQELLHKVLIEYGYTNLTELYKLHLNKENIMIDGTELDKIVHIFCDVVGTSKYCRKINENIYDEKWVLPLTTKINDYTNKHYTPEYVYQLFVLFIRTSVHLLLSISFRAMGVDLSDPNVSVMYGSLGTPSRIAKMWTCKNIYDLNEFLSGRFALEPKLVVFPADNLTKRHPVTVTVTINSVCSHHLVRFGNEFRNPDSKAVISYIPNKKVLGLSKINRWVEWTARRGWLQENLCNYIGKTLQERLETEDVYVALMNMQHGCVAFRGKNDVLAYTSTEYYGGKYDNIEFRNQILKSI